MILMAASSKLNNTSTGTQNTTDIRQLNTTTLTTTLRKQGWTIGCARRDSKQGHTQRAQTLVTQQEIYKTENQNASIGMGG
ncbi:hypothetical protein VTO73DRAFT_820 [Trametes versicolor]